MSSGIFLGQFHNLGVSNTLHYIANIYGISSLNIEQIWMIYWTLSCCIADYVNSVQGGQIIVSTPSGKIYWFLTQESSCQAQEMFEI